MPKEPITPQPAEPDNTPIKDPQPDKDPVQPPPGDPQEDRPLRDLFRRAATSRFWAPDEMLSLMER